MDARDVIRKAETKTVYTYYRINVLSQQSNCNYSTCCSTTNCVVNYPTYAEKQAVAEGTKNRNTCDQASETPS